MAQNMMVIGLRTGRMAWEPFTMKMGTNMLECSGMERRTEKGSITPAMVIAIRAIERMIRGVV